MMHNRTDKKLQPLVGEKMKIQNILFRADSSSIIGTGHIMRDLVLAKQFKDSNIIFATQELDGNINHKIIEAGYKIEILESNTIDELDGVIKKLNIDMLVIDHYDIDETQEKQLKIQNSTLKIMALDDTYEKHYCDILLNHNISANQNRYKELIPKECELRCGAKFTLLREEFLKEKNIKREKTYDYLLAFGGADSANLNIRVLKILLDIDKDSDIIVISTVANRNLEELRAFVTDRDNITLEINSNQVAKIINQTKLAIITPSVTANEVYFLQVPFIAIQIADNQEDIRNFLEINDYKVLKEFNGIELINLIKEAIL